MRIRQSNQSPEQMFNTIFLCNFGLICPDLLLSGDSVGKRFRRRECILWTTYLACKAANDTIPESLIL